MIGQSGFPDPSVDSVADATRCRVEVQTTSGRAAAVDFRVRLDLVEVWHMDHCAGVFDRDALREWLADPDRPLVVDEVALSLDRAVDRHGRVAINLPDVMAWTLSPVEVLDLREKVGGRSARG